MKTRAGSLGRAGRAEGFPRLCTAPMLGASVRRASQDREPPPPRGVSVWSRVRHLGCPSSGAMAPLPPCRVPPAPPAMTPRAGGYASAQHALGAAAGLVPVVARVEPTPERRVPPPGGQACGCLAVLPARRRPLAPARTRWPLERGQGGVHLCSITISFAARLAMANRLRGLPRCRSRRWRSLLPPPSPRQLQCSRAVLHLAVCSLPCVVLLFTRWPAPGTPPPTQQNTRPPNRIVCLALHQAFDTCAALLLCMLPSAPDSVLLPNPAMPLVSAPGGAQSRGHSNADQDRLILPSLTSCHVVSGRD